MSTGVCPDQNRTVRNHNAHRCDERLQVLLPHPRLPCGPSWRIRLIPGRYKTPSHRGPSAAAEGLTYYWSIFPAGRACHLECVAVSRPLRLLVLSRRMIESVQCPETAQPAPAGSRPRTYQLKQASDGSYMSSFPSKFV